MPMSFSKRQTVVALMPEQCRRVAEMLAQVLIPLPDEDTPLDSVAPAELPNFYLSIVAICHQTSPLGQRRLEGRTRDRRRLFGWDYLRCRWAERVADNPALNTPATWAGLEAADIERILQDESGESTISDAAGRASLLQDIWQQMLRTRLSSAREIFDQSQGHLISSSPLGLFARLETLRAYSDPVRKKSCFFLELMRGQCGWSYADPSNLGAPVDYHEVRGHLRLGTVAIVDSTLETKVRSGQQTTDEEDQAIRGAVYEAIGEISRLLGSTDPATLHYLFWNFFRQCCGREIPHCGGCDESCGLPARYRNAFKHLSTAGCLFRPICPSAGRANKLTEHFHRTDFY